VLSTLAVLYGGTFVLFGGLDDTGGSYALSVAALAILSIASFLFRKKLAWRFGLLRSIERGRLPGWTPYETEHESARTLSEIPGNRVCIVGKFSLEQWIARNAGNRAGSRCSLNRNVGESRPLAFCIGISIVRLQAPSSFCCRFTETTSSVPGRLIAPFQTPAVVRF
jgi:hypothetical protein